MEKTLYEQASGVIVEIIEKAHLSSGDILVIGCSTSEIIGSRIGTNSAPEVAEEVFSAFYDCAELGAYNGFVLVLPSQLKTIGASAFAYCWNFLYVVIPESVESIGYDAFGTAFRLTIYCEAKERPEGWDAYWAHFDHSVVWGYVASEA
jgi:hypothetical protein